MAGLLKNEETHQATVAYLTAMDTESARQLLGSQDLILGASGGELRELAPRYEKALQEELKSTPRLKEIFAMFTTGY